jgi:phosphoglycerol transferase MdoB-like AlkP superfamily enzyme
MFDILRVDVEKSVENNVFVLFTLSSHEPYEVPYKDIYQSDNEWNRARNSYLYTDSCVNVFLTALKQSPKWEKSLVILVADHGSLFPGNKAYWSASKYKTFMLWTGGVVENQPFVFSNLADQLDISATLLPLLNIPSNDFIFSDNLFKKKNTNTYFSFINGFGFIKNDKFCIYSSLDKRYFYISDSTDITADYAKTYIQKLSDFYKTLE